MTCVLLVGGTNDDRAGNEKAAGGPGHGHLRASHADRERVIAALKTAFIQGRLTKDEFDSRMGRALGARTYAELAALTADIPGELTGPAARNALQADIRPRHHRPPRRIAGSLAAIAVLVAAISVASLSHRSAAFLSHRPAILTAPRSTGPIMYVVASNGMTPIATATNTPGKPIKISGTAVAIAITPDGKTAYVATSAYLAGHCPGCPVGTVIPVATATSTPGKAIDIGRIPKGIAFAS